MQKWEKYLRFEASYNLTLLIIHRIDIERDVLLQKIIK